MTTVRDLSGRVSGRRFRRQGSEERQDVGTYAPIDPADWTQGNAAYMGGKGNLVYDVTKYGATGDGVADDTAEIQAAINAAATAGGGIVFIPEGIYLVGTLTVGNNVVLAGAHREGSVLRCVDSSNGSTTILSKTGGSGVYVRDLTIDGARDNATGLTATADPLNSHPLVLFDTVADATFENVELTRHATPGITGSPVLQDYLRISIAFFDTCTSVTLRDVAVSNAYMEGVGAYAGGRVHIYNFHSDGPSGIGGGSGLNILGSPANLEVVGGHIENTTGSAANLSGNVVSVHGMQVDSPGGNGLDFTEANDIALVNGRISVSGVTVINCQKAGLRLAGEAITAVGNVVEDCGIGVFADLRAGDHATIGNNYVKNAYNTGAETTWGAGIMAQGTSTQAGNAIVSANVTEGCVQGLRFRRLVHAAASNNFLSGPSAWSILAGDAGGVLCDTVTLTGNRSDKRMSLSEITSLRAWGNDTREAAATYAIELGTNITRAEVFGNRGRFYDNLVGGAFRVVDEAVPDAQRFRHALQFGDDKFVYFDGSGFLRVAATTPTADAAGNKFLLDTANTWAARQVFADVEIDGALDHDGTTVGFYGVAPATRPTALTAADASVVDTTYGTEEAAVINNLRTRVNELETKLQTLGLLT